MSLETMCEIKDGSRYHKLKGFWKMLSYSVLQVQGLHYCCQSSNVQDTFTGKIQQSWSAKS